jgi:hypothetical protein
MSEDRFLGIYIQVCFMEINKYEVFLDFNFKELT